MKTVFFALLAVLVLVGSAQAYPAGERPGVRERFEGIYSGGAVPTPELSPEFTITQSLEPTLVDFYVGVVVSGPPKLDFTAPMFHPTPGLTGGGSIYELDILNVFPEPILVIDWEPPTFAFEDMFHVTLPPLEAEFPAFHWSGSSSSSSCSMVAHFVTSLPVGIQATAVPLPAGMWLLGAGLAALGVLKRRRS